METPETIFKTWMSRVWNQLDVAAIDELMAPNAPVHGLGEEPLPGAAGFNVFCWDGRDAFCSLDALCPSCDWEPPSDDDCWPFCPEPESACCGALPFPSSSFCVAPPLLPPSFCSFAWP